MVTWIPSIYPLYVSIYTSTMDPMGYGHSQDFTLLSFGHPNASPSSRPAIGDWRRGFNRWLQEAFREEKWWQIADICD